MDAEEMGKVFARVMMFLILFPLGIYVHALTISKLWEWYVVVQFGVATLPLVVAWGLSIFVKFISMDISDFEILYTDSKKSETGIVKYDYLNKMGLGLFFSLFTLFLGWVGTFFL